MVTCFANWSPLLNMTMKNDLQDELTLKRVRGVALYFFLFTMETAGAVLYFVNIIPINREVMRDITMQGTNVDVLWYELAVIALIQGGYWLRVKLDPPMPKFQNIVLFHIISFIGRLNFVTVTAVFSFYVVSNFDRITVSFGRSLLVWLALFSMFCWTLELERLAKVFHRPEAATKPERPQSFMEEGNQGETS